MTARKKDRGFQLPPVVAGDWRGEIVGAPSVNFGQVVQPGPPRQSVELTYIILPATLIMPNAAFMWPGVVTRAQLSDILPRIAAVHVVLILRCTVCQTATSDMLRVVMAVQHQWR